MGYFTPKALLVAFYFAVLPGQAGAQAIGEAADVDFGATLTRSGQVSKLSDGATVSTGDVIATNRTGQVQLLFYDETRIAIGPNSQFLVEDVRLRSSGTAKKFTVSAIAGGFRFITGKSQKSAYSIKTPTATMGIRGTSFDFVVTRRAGTDLAIYTGAVRICGASGNCARISGECNTATIDTGGKLDTSDRPSKKDELIAKGFPFASGQQKLAREFRTSAKSCGGDTMTPAVQANDKESAPRSTPPKEPPPGPPKEPPREQPKEQPKERLKPEGLNQ